MFKMFQHFQRFSTLVFEIIMEVLSFIISDQLIIDCFRCFIKSYNKLEFSNQDIDTEFYTDPSSGRNEIYFHFIPNDTEEELVLQYTNEEQDKIRTYFFGKNIFIFDIQYRDEIVLNDLLDNFNDYLKNKEIGLNKEVLLSHPFEGIKCLEEVSNEHQVIIHVGRDVACNVSTFR